MHFNFIPLSLVFRWNLFEGWIPREIACMHDLCSAGTTTFFFFIYINIFMAVEQFSCKSSNPSSIKWTLNSRLLIKPLQITGSTAFFFFSSLSRNALFDHLLCAVHVLEKIYSAIGGSWLNSRVIGEAHFWKTFFLKLEKKNLWKSIY